MGIRSVSATSAWQLSWLVGAALCALAGVWFLALTVPDEDLPLGGALALGFAWSV